MLQLNLVNLKSWGLENLFRSTECSNYRELDIRIYNLQKWLLSGYFPVEHKCFLCVKETSQRNVSFMHTKHMFYR